LHVVIKESFILDLLLFEFLHFLHDSLSFLNLALFSKFLSIFVIEVNLGIQLVDLLVDVLLLEGVHLVQVRGLLLLMPPLGPVFSTSKFTLDLLVDLCDHL
jgi:hypothetical protein